MNSIQKKDFWQNHIEDCDKSELSQAEYCAVHKIALSTFGYWKRKLKKDSHCTPVFYPLAISAAHSGKDGINQSCLLLHLQGKRFTIEIEKGFSVSTLSQLVTTLEQL